MIRKPCRKCMLAELDRDEFTANLIEKIKNYPAEKRVDEKQYRDRLSQCRVCPELSDGMCLKCGCYVELRALKPLADCPAEINRWENHISSDNA